VNKWPGNSFDYLVGAEQQFVADLQPKRVGGFEIEDHLEPSPLHHRQVGRFLALRRMPVAAMRATSPRSSSNRIGSSVMLKFVTPVTFPPGPTEARNEADFHRVCTAGEDNRNRRHGLGGECRGRASRCQLDSECRESLKLTLCPAEFNPAVRRQQENGSRQEIGTAQPVRCFPRVSGRNSRATRQST
jgi:hypothetical protein